MASADCNEATIVLCPNAQNHAVGHNKVVALLYNENLDPRYASWKNQRFHGKVS
jgi:hypothetical protein